ncbi:RNA 2',3'-cyclic phosphodiesterase [Patescibacteria group bacterium]|nr:RNA 2',3'-cyclic phosphodiesterase [Patescibacteria group bacterium]
MAKTRTFIAINLPQEIKQELGNWVENIKKDINTGVKWVKPENFHLTLHFLGYLEEKQLEQVKTILQSSVFKTDIVLKIKKPDCFPNQNRPRVLFFKCEEKENNNLINLQQIIGQSLKHIGMEVDDRVWQIHLTFARVKMPIKLPTSFKKEIPDLKFKIKSIDLMKSVLRRTGPIYSIIESFPLKSIC